MLVLYVNFNLHISPPFLLYLIIYLLRNLRHLPYRIFHILDCVYCMLIAQFLCPLYFLQTAAEPRDLIRPTVKSFGKTTWWRTLSLGDIYLPGCLSFRGLSSVWYSVPSIYSLMVAKLWSFNSIISFIHLLDKKFLQKDAFPLLLFGHPVQQFV